MGSTSLGHSCGRSCLSLEGPVLAPKLHSHHEAPAPDVQDGVALRQLHQALRAQRQRSLAWAQSGDAQQLAGLSVQAECVSQGAGLRLCNACCLTA